MLYSEFIQGTGAKDTEYNYRVYKNLEALYMTNDSMTKADVYKAAAALIDNSETPAEKEIRERLENDIATATEAIAAYNLDIDMYNHYIEIETDAAMRKFWRGAIKGRRELIKAERAQISRAKFLLKL